MTALIETHFKKVVECIAKVQMIRAKRSVSYKDELRDLEKELLRLEEELKNERIIKESWRETQVREE